MYARIRTMPRPDGIQCSLPPSDRGRIWIKAGSFVAHTNGDVVGTDSVLEFNGFVRVALVAVLVRVRERLFEREPNREARGGGECPGLDRVEHLLLEGTNGLGATTENLVIGNHVLISSFLMH